MRWFDTTEGMGAVTRDNATAFFITGEAAYAKLAADILASAAKDARLYLLGWSCDHRVRMQPSAPATFEDIAKAFSTAGGVTRTMLWDNRLPGFPSGTAEATKFINSLAGGAAILDRRTPFAGSHHQKMQAVVGSDGAPVAAFCGGMDLFSDRLVGGSGPAPLHDVHARIAGSGATKIIQTFIERWNDHPARSGDLSASTTEPLTPLDGSDLVQVGRTYPRFEPFYAQKANLFDRYARPNLPAQTPVGDMQDGSAIRLYNFYDTTKGVQQIWRMIRHAVRTAQKFIYFEDQYLVSESVGKLLAAKLKSAPPGFRLIILLGKEPDFPQVWPRRRAALAPLQSVDPQQRRWRVFYRRLDRPSYYVHSKTWIFDDELVITGSANSDRRGMTYSSELSFGAAGELVGTRRSTYGAKTIAQDLRCQLWTKHLGGKPADYLSMRPAIGRWFGPPNPGNVRLYKPNERVGDPDPNLKEFPPAAIPGLLLAAGTLSREDAIYDLVEDPDTGVSLSL